MQKRVVSGVLSGWLMALALVGGWLWRRELPRPNLAAHNVASPASTARISPALSAWGSDGHSKQWKNALAEPEAALQLPYATLSAETLSLPFDLPAARLQGRAALEIPGRRRPELVPFAELNSPQLTKRVVPLPEANTLAHVNFAARRFGRLQTSRGDLWLFNPETILVKFRSLRHVAALRVEPLREWEAVQRLGQRPDVQFAELDRFEQRQFSPNDPQLANQWHHPVLGSFRAWDWGLGQSSIRIAIVDTPFQMNHPDLAANTVEGWDAVANTPIVSGSGIVHSTMCAGLAAAVVNNQSGVAGLANCAVLPININGAISEMYNAVIWAADHGVRVVNISWSGANSDTLETAGAYLKTRARGILAMAAIDGTGALNWTNQPDIYCIAMTDAADNFVGTMSGPYIDFAAPGYQVFSTLTGGGYGFGTGTSYATPLFAGVVAGMFSLNPTLGPDEVLGILKATSSTLGFQGWNPYYGWGRINFAAAAAATASTLPVIAAVQISNQQATVSTKFTPGLTYALWRAPQLSPPAWQPVTNVAATTNAGFLLLTDPTPTSGRCFYRICVSRP